MVKKVKITEVNLKKEKIIEIKRVTNTKEGGRRLGFSALVIIGDGNGCIGYGIGSAIDVNEAVKKAVNNAKKKLIRISLTKDRSIYHEVYARYNGSIVFLKPAAKGTGVKAGGVARYICKEVGIENILSKILRGGGKYNCVIAVFKALEKLRDPKHIAKVRGISMDKLFNG